LSFTGGVALNAVANGKTIHSGSFDNYYFTPAAGDNGLAIGCAYYGWLEVLKREKVLHNGVSSFGKVYTNAQIKQELQNFTIKGDQSAKPLVKSLFENISSFTNKDAVNGKSYLIRFVIPEIGIYNLSIKNGGTGLVNEDADSPDCTLVTDEVTFMNGLADKNYLINSIRNNASILKGDIQYFLDTMHFDALSGFVKDLANSNGTFKQVRFTEEKDVIKKTAALLAEGKIIGWFQGGCEFGPRALGNRSILADPRKPGVQDFINQKIKFREDFRPFAPSVLQEDASEYFEFSGESPYMIITAQVKEKWKNEIKGIIHVDNSARIQTVTPTINEKYYHLLKAFKSLTNLPILLNTSFNKKGMPIVETPAQALSYFFECALDYLVIGDFIVSKDEEPLQ
jgi:predicted NodU family carbamoyl transferase